MADTFTLTDPEDGAASGCVVIPGRPPKALAELNDEELLDLAHTYPEAQAAPGPTDRNTPEEEEHMTANAATPTGSRPPGR